MHFLKHSKVEGKFLQSFYGQKKEKKKKTRVLINKHLYMLPNSHQLKLATSNFSLCSIHRCGFRCLSRYYFVIVDGFFSTICGVEI